VLDVAVVAVDRERVTIGTVGAAEQYPSGMAPTVVVALSDRFAGTAARMIANRIDEAIVVRGACAFALCGGGTPVPVYQELAAMPIRWATVAIYFGDERAVPPAEPDSNFGMARHALLDRVAIPAQCVHRMEAERDDVDAAAAEYDRVLPPRLDLLLLGVGPDGHTASLFPNSPALRETRRRVLAVASPPPPLEPQLRRMTITPSVIAAARHVIVLVRGSDKAALLQRILEGPDQPIKLPAQLALRGTWVVDQAAAGQLRRRDT
jgi:6-phosphogluconolactonase